MSDKVDLLPEQVLRDLGCRSCVWKEFGQCPRGLTGSRVLSKGYCSEFSSFLYQLLGDGTVSSLKEKYHLYVQELQASHDLRKFRDLQRRYDELRSSDNVDVKLLESVRLELELCKQWWNRLTYSVVMG